MMIRIIKIDSPPGILLTRDVFLDSQECAFNRYEGNFYLSSITHSQVYAERNNNPHGNTTP